MSKKVIIFFLLFVSFLSAQALTGNYYKVEGRVETTAQGQAPSAAKQGMAVNGGDTVKSMADGKAIIIFANSNEIRIAPNTEIVISAENVNDQLRKHELKSGKMMLEVLNKLQKGYELNLEVPSSIIGVRGTTYVVDFNEERTILYVTTGVVEFTSKVTGELQKVTTNEMLELNAAGVFEAVKLMSKADLKEMMRNLPDKSIKTGMNEIPKGKKNRTPIQFVAEVGNGFSFGNIEVQGVNGKIHSSSFNPVGYLEARFFDKLGLGMGYKHSKDKYSGEWTASGADHAAIISVKRTTFDVYTRFIPVKSFNIRLGYRNHNYNYSKGELVKYKKGVLKERTYNAQATGKATTGIDTEINVITGKLFKYRFGLGSSYFNNILYTYDYEHWEAGKGYSHPKGSAKSSAIAAALINEFSYDFKLFEFYARHQINTVIRIGDADDWFVKNYSGYEFDHKVIAGVYYKFGL